MQGQSQGAFHHQTIIADGSSVAVAVRGHEDGIPVVFLHGNSLSATGHMEWWRPYQAEHLRLIAIDFPGHGASPWSSTGLTYSLGSLAQIVRATLSALAATRPVLIGHSLGGNVALELAGQHLPLRGLVCYGAPPLPRISGLTFPSVAQPLLAEYPSTNELVRLGAYMSAGEPPEWWMAEFHATDPRVRSGLAAALAAAEWVDQPSWLAAPTCPVLMACGGNDPFVDSTALLAMGQSWWHGGPQVVSGASHLGMDHPGVQSIIMEFLEEIAHGRST